MNHLKTIQSVIKVLRVLTIIAIICLAIGVGCCLIAIPILIAVRSLPIGELTLEELIFNEAGYYFIELISLLAVGIITCIAYGVLMFLVLRYLNEELLCGTPFTRKGARQLLTLGILGIVIPIVTSTASSIVAFWISPLFMNYEVSYDLTFGLSLLFFSLIANYGASLIEEKELAEGRYQALKRQFDTANAGSTEEKSAFCADSDDAQNTDSVVPNEESGEEAVVSASVTEDETSAESNTEESDILQKADEANGSV